MQNDAGNQIKMNSPDRILIVCVGNGLAGDDGAGQAVYDALRRRSLPDRVELVHLGLGGMALLDYFQGQHALIVVDAVQLNAEPGTLHVLEWDRLTGQESQAVSLHGIGLLETLQVARALYPEMVPQRAVLIGLEGRCFNELGVPLSGAVEHAVPAAVEAVLREVNQLREVESLL
jgi:hydrogenase maturation protease